MKKIDGKIYYSLYEYLGYAAGSSLGEEVNQVAIKLKQKFVKQYVENSLYQGEVFCYTKEFLDEYFHSKQEDPKDFTIMDPVYLDNENDNLPF
jgi:hypothetical protein